MKSRRKTVNTANLKRTIRTGSLVILTLLSAKSVVAQKTDPCSQQAYKVLGQSAIAIRCVDDVSNLGIIGGTGTVISHDSAAYAQPIANVEISFFKTEKTWLLLILSGSPGSLQASKKYSLALTYTVKCTKDCAGAATTTVGPISNDIDTTETITISPSVVDSSPKSFTARSSVGFAAKGKTLSVSTRQLNVKGQSVLLMRNCTIQVLDGVNRATSLEASCSQFTSLPDPPTKSDLQGVDPEEVGTYDIDFHSQISTPLIPGSLGFKTIFGNAPKIDPKSRFSPKKAPATKDASQYYINFNWAAGVGTVPAWVLDGQITPTLWMWRGFAFGPLATADVGNNKLSGQTYTDTIDFGFTSQRPFFFRKNCKPLLDELLLTSGIKYETDKEFDRDNLLATADLKYYFRGLYRTQSVVALQQYYKALQSYQNKKAQAGTTSTMPYEPQVDDFQPPLIGYALDFHTGIETGGAVHDTTVKATTGNATADLPTYSIFRIVPQVHGLLQIWKFSFDTNMTGRYLALTENTIQQTPTDTLILKKESGWKGIETLTSTYNIDSLGHFALNVVFKDGFAPPTYNRVNAVQVGILVKY
jgi:hypothetical protein